MSVSLKEVLENAGYDLKWNKEDIQRTLSMLSESDDLKEELENNLDRLEDLEEESRYDAWTWEHNEESDDDL